MFRELVAAVWKNLLRLFRSKVSAAAILAGPLLLIIIIGLAFGNTKLQGIKVGTYVEQNTSAIDNIIKNLEKNKQTFTINRYDTNVSCVESVKDGDSHICVSFLQGKGQVNVYFYVDYSRLSLVYVLLSAMNTQVSDEAAHVGTEVSRSLLDKVGSINEYIVENNQTLSNLSQGSAQMLANVKQIKSSIANLDLSNPVDTNQISQIAKQAQQERSTIIQTQKQIDDQIASARSQISQTQASLASTKASLRADQEKLNKSIVQLQITQSAMQCPSDQLIDLTPYLNDNATLQKELATIKRPDCAVVYTARLNLLDLQRQSIDIDTKISQEQDQLAYTQQQLDTFQSQSRTGSTQAIQQIDDATKELNTFNDQIEQGNQKLADMQDKQKDLVKKLTAAEDALTQSQNALGQMQQGINDVKGSLDSVSTVTPEAIIRPFSTNVQSLTGTKKQFDFLFPSLLTLIIMFVSVLAASTIVMKEKASRAYFRNLIMPSSLLTLFAGVLITSAILTLLQVSVIMIIASIFFGVQFTNIISVLILCFIGIFLFSCIGMIFGFIFTSEETTTILSIIFCVILFLFSSTIIPIESMNPTIAKFAEVNPFVIMELALRHVLIFNSGIAFNLQLLLLIIELFALGALAAYIIDYTKKNM